MPGESAAVPDLPQDPRVAEVLQQLRAGVRQRQAEAATMGGAPGGRAGSFAQALLAVRAAEYVEEPVPFSHRPRYGNLIVRARKAFFSFFLKWFVRPVMAQQNAFNQAAGRMLQELAESEERTAREVRLLAARLAELETRPGPRAAVAAPEPATAPPEPGAVAPEPDAMQRGGGTGRDGLAEPGR
ncbi:MAG: hypothetical protein JOZ15_12500 [Acidobacteria bacterium]|nr:hypothetical protein [Acidobacteriota bacterium]